MDCFCNSSISLGNILYPTFTYGSYKSQDKITLLLFYIHHKFFYTLNIRVNSLLFYYSTSSIRTLTRVSSIIVKQLFCWSFNIVTRMLIKSEDECIFITFQECIYLMFGWNDSVSLWHLGDASLGSFPSGHLEHLTFLIFRCIGFSICPSINDSYLQEFVLVPIL